MLVFTGMPENSPDKAVSAQGYKAEQLANDNAISPSEDKAIKVFEDKAITPDSNKDRNE